MISTKVLLVYVGLIAAVALAGAIDRVPVQIDPDGKMAEFNESFEPLAVVYSSTAAATGEEKLSSIVWSYECHEFSKVAWTGVKNAFMSDMWAGVPFTIVILPDDSGNVCMHSPEYVRSLCESQGIPVEEVSRSTDFNADMHYARFPGHRAHIVSSNGKLLSLLSEDDDYEEEVESLDSKSVDELAAKVDSAMSSATEHRNELDELLAFLRSSTKGSCDTSAPQLEDCTRSECAEYKKKCSRVLGIKHNCRTYCVRQETRMEAACQARNAHLNAAYAEKIDRCTREEQLRARTVASIQKALDGSGQRLIAELAAVAEMLR
jgi:hypothetical protein